MILDKLIEKKDLLIYIDQRILTLKKNRDAAVQEARKELRGRVIEKFNSRIFELEIFRTCIHNDRIKDMAKYYWKKNH